MPKQWNCNQEKKFAREVEFGKTYYVIRERETRLSDGYDAPWIDPQAYEEHVFTERSFLGTPRTDGGMTATELCRNWGPVYDTKPSGMRRTDDPGPRLAGPLGSTDYEAILDESELRGLEKRVRDGSHPHKRRPAGNWRP